MKAISLWEPYATAIAIGIKRNETRSWSTTVRETIAIHAAQKKACAWMIRGHGIIARAFEEAGILHEDQLAFGCVVAIADLVDCIPTEKIGTLSALEKTLGDYNPGRFAWKLENVRRLEKPIPAIGRQGFWHWSEAGLIGGNFR